jgi:hypothetical protein
MPPIKASSTCVRSFEKVNQVEHLTRAWDNVVVLKGKIDYTLCT